MASFTRVLPIAFAAATLIAGSSVASASPSADFNFSYVGVTGSAGSATGELFTTDNGNGTYTIVGISGERNGSAITGLDPVNTDGSDNTLTYPGTPYFSFGGVSFTTADGGDWNIYSNAGAYYENYASGPNFNDATGQIDVSVSPVPEPSSLLMLGTGFVGVFGVARRKFLNL